MIITFNSSNADAIFGESPGNARHAAPPASVPHGLPGARPFPIFGRRPRRQRATGSDTPSSTSPPPRDDERRRRAGRRGR